MVRKFARIRAGACLLSLLTMIAVLATSAAAQAPPYITQWGSNGIGIGQFSYPSAVATDPAGNIYVGDVGNRRIQKFTSTGAYLTQWGDPDSSSSEPYAMDPEGVATDAAGNVYVTDFNNNRILKFTSTGTYLTQWGGFGTGDGQFSHPFCVATDAAGNAYVTDNFNYRIQKFTSTGTFLAQWGSPGWDFHFPTGVATDPAGNVYVADNNDFIQKFTSTGAYLTHFGGFGTGDGRLDQPIGVATDATGNVYVADMHNNRIQIFTSTGTYLTQWGSPGTGTGQFSRPYSVAIDAVGNVYVADTYNHRIEKFGPASGVGVPGKLPITFALDPVRPNPARGSALTVQFTLPSAAPASLELLDVAGRLVSANEVGQLGAGRHALDFGTGRSLEPGIYLVRLQQGANVKVARAAVLE